MRCAVCRWDMWDSTAHPSALMAGVGGSPKPSVRAQRLTSTSCGGPSTQCVCCKQDLMIRLRWDTTRQQGCAMIVRDAQRNRWKLPDEHRSWRSQRSDLSHHPDSEDSPTPLSSIPNSWPLHQKRAAMKHPDSSIHRRFDQPPHNYQTLPGYGWRQIKVSKFKMTILSVSSDPQPQSYWSSSLTSKACLCRYGIPCSSNDEI